TARSRCEETTSISSPLTPGMVSEMASARTRLCSNAELQSTEAQDLTMTRSAMSHDPIERLVDAVNEIARQTLARVRVGLTHDDADHDLGSFATDDAIGFDPFPVLRALDTAGARVVVMGQVAGMMHGSAELTGDLDLIWDGETENAGALARAFQ